ncbi:hypothetical protein [Dictyobacter alpinus]|uniref:hypothetical protein n=1 Tax=Dictyobacter alpinus TaxID=2014873 RepID=UPI000F824FCA|nr:hypothetical protein [Dictyobacter alpinus]
MARLLDKNRSIQEEAGGPRAAQTTAAPGDVRTKTCQQHRLASQKMLTDYESIMSEHTAPFFNMLAWLWAALS